MRSTIRNGLRGSYSVFAELACGGMALVHLGQREGELGFRRPVAIKQMHPQYARDREFRQMFVDEARLVAKIRHPNVVPTLDVVADGDDLLIVMEFVEGEAVSQLIAASQGPIAPPLVAAVAHDVLCGLHAAHELTGDDGSFLGVIHRDISPANILVGRDGMSRVLDFGVAKAAGRMVETKGDVVKGKVPYMAPEQICGGDVDRTADVYAMAVVMWEMLTGRRLFTGANDAEIMHRVLEGRIAPPSSLVPHAAPLDAVIMRGLSADPRRRFPTAHAMAKAIEEAVTPMARLDVGEWVGRLASRALERRRALVRQMERGEPRPTEGGLEHSSMFPMSNPGFSLTDALAVPTIRTSFRRSARLATGVLVGMCLLTSVSTILASQALGKTGTPGAPAPPRSALAEKSARDSAASGAEAAPVRPAEESSPAPSQPSPAIGRVAARPGPKGSVLGSTRGLGRTSAVARASAPSHAGDISPRPEPTDPSLGSRY